MSTTTPQVYKASDTALHPGKYYYFCDTRHKVPNQTIYDKVSKKQIPNPNFDISKFTIVDKPSGRKPKSSASSQIAPLTEPSIVHKFTAPQLSEALSVFPNVQVSSVARNYFRKSSNSIKEVIDKINQILKESPDVNFISYSPTKNKLLLSTRAPLSV